MCLQYKKQTKEYLLVQNVFLFPVYYISQIKSLVLLKPVCIIFSKTKKKKKEFQENTVCSRNFSSGHVLIITIIIIIAMLSVLPRCYLPKAVNFWGWNSVFFSGPCSALLRILTILIIRFIMLMNINFSLTMHGIYSKGVLTLFSRSTQLKYCVPKFSPVFNMYLIFLYLN